MTILKNTTSDNVLKIKERTGFSWDMVCNMIDMTKPTLYRRMAKGDWKKSEIFYIRHIAKK